VSGGRRLATFAVATVVAGCGGEPPAVRPHDPVIFVHGLHGSPAAWRTMVARFAADGWRPADLDVWRYDSRQPNAATAARLAAEVARVRAATGAAKVDLVTHSMGALPSRWFLARLGGAGVVDHWVSLGGPNHGIAGASLCPEASCREMQPGSRFLAALNGGDETPGAVRYATWRSPCDTIINPDASVPLRGARNVRTACLGHGALITAAGVYRQVRDFIAP
jgi:triacylglycerol lipase